jgi:hypothetical protein
MKFELLNAGRNTSTPGELDAADVVTDEFPFSQTPTATAKSNLNSCASKLVGDFHSQLERYLSGVPFNERLDRSMATKSNP